MLQSERCAKSLLPSPVSERTDSSFHNFQMGNTNHLTNTLLDADESQLSPKFRRRKVSTQQSQSAPQPQQSSLLSPTRNLSTISSPKHIDSTQTTYKDSITLKVNGMSPDTKTVTFSLKPRTHHQSQTQQQVVGVGGFSTTTAKKNVNTEPSTSSSSTQQSNTQETHLPKIVITDEEMNNLKELVLLHLDLEQQQQSIIAEKDKMIAELRAESNMLRTRLERMDRRLSVAKSSASAKTKRGKSTPASSSASVTQSEPSTSKQSSSSKRDQKGAAENVTESPESTLPNIGKTEPFKLQDWKPKASKKLKNTQKQLKIKKSAKKRKKSQKNDGLLRVDSEYYTQQVQEFEELAEETIPNSKDTQAIEVPSFRVQTFANCYNLEGTEDVDEQTFLKRHQRHETDEKKRKRWDLQMQREQHVIEKLKQNQSTSAAQKQAAPSRDKHVENIFPKAEHAEYIEICDTLPVNVFGHPLPQFPPSEFSLPWYDPPSRCSHSNTSRKRSKR